MKNFRDIGGIETISGKYVKKGLFFRSAHLNNLTDDEISDLKKLNIRHILDYRCDYEAENKPTTNIDGIKILRITAMDMPGEKDVKGKSCEEIIRDIFNNDGAYKMFTDRYYNLPINNRAYKKLVELIKKPQNVPILSHCTSGKDRTGIGVAIILMILGVSRENIIKDYMLSNNFANEAIDEYIKLNPDYKEVAREKLNHIFGVNEAYINMSFRRIDEMYKSEEEYLYKEFNLSKDDIGNIRHNYLE